MLGDCGHVDRRLAGIAEEGATEATQSDGVFLFDSNLPNECGPRENHVHLTT
jgi:hypothetical protein